MERKNVVVDSHRHYFSLTGLFDDLCPIFCRGPVYLHAFLNLMQILKTLWNKWKFVAAKIGLFQSRLILTIFYYTLLLPFSLIMTYLSDALKIKRKYTSSWVVKFNQSENLSDLKNQ